MSVLQETFYDTWKALKSIFKLCIHRPLCFIALRQPDANKLYY